MTKNLFLVTLAICLLHFTSCKVDDPILPNQEEIITTMTLELSSNNHTPTLTFKDLDGEGGNDPVIMGATLEAHTIYSGTITLLNEQSSTVESVSQEVIEEAEDHQLFYETDIPGLKIGYDDQDADGNPLGIMTTIETGEPGVGTLTITLLHEPDKDADGVADGRIDAAGGSTDFKATFPIVIE